MRLVLMFAFISFTGLAQEKVYGDSTVVKNIKPIASKIYETKDKTHFFLTKKNLLKKKTFGTNIIAHSKEGKVNRIITISTTRKGILSTEYYFENSKLIYSYQTFEYFDEYKKLGKWVNFKGLASWEGKYYIVEDKIKYQRTKGVEIRDMKKRKDIVSESYAILEYVYDSI